MAKTSAIGGIGIVHNWWSSSHRTIFDDNENEMEQLLSKEMNEFVKIYLNDKKNEGYLTGDYKLIHIPLTNAVVYMSNSREYNLETKKSELIYKTADPVWNVSNRQTFSLGWTLGSSSNVYVIGTVHAKLESSNTRSCYVKYRRNVTNWGWRDTMDAKFYTEKGSSSDKIANAVEGTVDVLFEKVGGVDFDFTVLWKYRNDREYTFEPWRTK